MVGAAGRKRAGQSIVQTDDRGVHAKDLLDLVETSDRTFTRLDDLLKQLHHDETEKTRESGSETIVEGTGREADPRDLLEGPAQVGDAAKTRAIEAEHQGPEELHRIDLALPTQCASRPGKAAELRGGKHPRQRSPQRSTLALGHVAPPESLGAHREKNMQHGPTQALARFRFNVLLTSA